MACEGRRPHKAICRGPGLSCIGIGWVRARLKWAQRMGTGEGQLASSTELLLRPAAGSPKKPDSSAGNSLSGLLASRLTDEETQAGEVSGVAAATARPLPPGPAPLCLDSVAVSSVLGLGPSHPVLQGTSRLQPTLVVHVFTVTTHKRSIMMITAMIRGNVVTDKLCFYVVFFLLPHLCTISRGHPISA